VQARGHNGGVHCLAATERPSSEPRGERDFVISGGADFTIVMWSDAGKLRRQYHGHAGAVRAVLVLGMSIWSCSDDSSVRVWDAAYGVFGLETAPCRATLTGHAGAVHALLLHSGGVLSCGADGAVRCWAVGGRHEASPNRDLHPNMNSYSKPNPNPTGTSVCAASLLVVGRSRASLPWGQPCGWAGRHGRLQLQLHASNLQPRASSLQRRASGL